MIIGRGTCGDGRPLIFIGLSEENVHRLRKGMPILRDLLPAIGVDAMITIVVGATEEAIAAQIQAAKMEIEPK